MDITNWSTIASENRRVPWHAGSGLRRTRRRVRLRALAFYWHAVFFFVLLWFGAKHHAPRGRMPTAEPCPAAVETGDRGDVNAAPRGGVPQATLGRREFRVLLCLCAAVSHFYVRSHRMPRHWIVLPRR